MWKRLARMRPRHLLLSWLGYWTGLLVATFWRTAMAIVRVSQAADGKGNASFNIGNDHLSLSVSEAGRTLWQGTITPVAAALWLGLPPLVLWLLWLSARRQEDLAPPHEQAALAPPSDLPFREQKDHSRVRSDT